MPIMFKTVYFSVIIFALEGCIKYDIVPNDPVQSLNLEYCLSMTVDTTHEEGLYSVILLSEFYRSGKKGLECDYFSFPRIITPLNVHVDFPIADFPYTETRYRQGDSMITCYQGEALCFQLKALENTSNRMNIKGTFTTASVDRGFDIFSFDINLNIGAKTIFYEKHVGDPHFFDIYKENIDKMKK